MAGSRLDREGQNGRARQRTENKWDEQDKEGEEEVQQMLTVYDYGRRVPNRLRRM